MPLPLQPRINLVKDTLQHPLWNSRVAASQMKSNSEEFIKFQKKFSADSGADGGIGDDVLAALAYDENAAAPIVIEPKVNTPVVQQKKKGRK